MKAAGSLFQIRRKGARTSNDIEQDVPLGAQNHQRTEPDVHVQPVVDDDYHKDRECEICGERSQELRERLDSFGKLRSKPDPDADGHPYQSGEHNQYHHARQGDETVSDGAEHVRDAQGHRQIFIDLPSGIGGARDDQCKPDTINEARRRATSSWYPQLRWKRDVQVRDDFVQGREWIRQRA